MLALEEKGYGKDEVALRQVDLSKGENYDVTFLRINPKATVPALVVPMEDSLSEDAENRYKALTDTTSIVQFLDKSRSAISRTHTTSSAPAPTLAPATVAFTNISNQVIGLVHSDAADPNHLSFVNAYDDASLRGLAKKVLPAVESRRHALDKYLADAEAGVLRVTDKVVKLWQERKAGQDKLYDVLKDADTRTSELSPEAKAKREQFFLGASSSWRVDLREAILSINKAIIGPFVLGDQFSIADVHLAGWLGRVIYLAGATAEDDGRTAIEKLEKRIGEEELLPHEVKWNGLEREGGESQSKLSAFWDLVKERPSWKKIYGAGLH